MEFVQAANYTRGRARKLRLIVIHSTQSPCNQGSARSVADYFARGPGASSHYICDPTATVQCVDDADTAWCAPNANADGLHIEQCGYAEWSRTEWLTDGVGQMIRTQVAPLVAAKAAQYGIPLVALTPDQVAAGAAGICQHIDITNAYPGSGSHWDCGSSYPMDVLLAAASGSDFAPAAVEAPDMIEADFIRLDQQISRGATRSSDAVINALGPKLDAIVAAIKAQPAVGGDVHVDVEALGAAIGRSLFNQALGKG